MVRYQFKVMCRCCALLAVTSFTPARASAQSDASVTALRLRIMQQSDVPIADADVRVKDTRSERSADRQTQPDRAVADAAWDCRDSHRGFDGKYRG